MMKGYQEKTQLHRVMEGIQKVVWEPDFFRPVPVGEFLNPAFLEKAAIDPSERVLVYGSRDDPKDVKIEQFISGPVDSSKYGPVVGILIPREMKNVFSFQGMQRVFYENTTSKS